MRDTSALNRRKVEVVVALGAVALVALALAFTTGMVTFGGDGRGGDVQPTASPTSGSAGGSGASSGGGGGGSGGAATPTPVPPFDLDVESVESCGQTCRDVTATLENQQERRATGVMVYTLVYAGKGTDGDVVWEGDREVGTLDAGGADTATQRMEIGYFDAIAIQRADGWITIVLTIETDRQTVSFQERRDVS